MTRVRYVAQILVIPMFVALAAAVLPDTAAWAQKDPFTLASPEIPARVKAIVGLPPTMDASNCVTWGRWEVCFGGQLPIARMIRPDPPVGPFLLIGPLRCRNPAVGETQCAMVFMTPWVANDPDFRRRNPHWRSNACRIVGWTEKIQGSTEDKGFGGEPQQFFINCPGVVLE